jgi:hypothetical protein
MGGPTAYMLASCASIQSSWRGRNESYELLKSRFLFPLGSAKRHSTSPVSNCGDIATINKRARECQRIEEVWLVASLSL